MGFDYEAGGENKLGIVRHGRELMEVEERIATGSDLYPGMAVEKTTDGNGDPAFQPHSGDVPENEVYVVVEARGRGMDAQTDHGYVADDDFARAVKASGGGLNLRLADAETVTNGDALVVNPGGDGDWLAYDSGVHSVDDIAAHADEDLDLTGGDAVDELVQAEMEGGN